MHEARGVERLQSFERLHEQLHARARRQVVLRDRLEQRDAHAWRDEQVVIGDRRRHVRRQDVRVLDRGDACHRGEVVVVITPRHLVGAQLVQVVRVEHLADDALFDPRLVVATIELVDGAHAAVREMLTVRLVDVPVVAKDEVLLREVVGPQRSHRRGFDPRTGHSPPLTTLRRARTARQHTRKA